MERTQTTPVPEIVLSLVAGLPLRCHDQTMSRTQLPCDIRQGALCTIFLLMVAACAPPSQTGDTVRASERAELLGKLKAMDGQSGRFEGFYSAGIHEGSSFAFCTKNECPDLEEMDCEPAFSEEATAILRPFWRTNDYAGIHMFALGTLHTLVKDGKASGYGHLDQHVCEIVISHVDHPRIVETPVVRSMRYPELAKPLK